MGRSGARITVHLSPGELALVHAGGTERLGLDPERWQGIWSDRLRSLDQPLREMMMRAGVRAGASVRVVAQTPETFVDVLSYPVSHAHALEAARLAARERAPFDTGLSPCAVADLGTGPGRDARVLLIAAEKNELAETIAAWVGRAGLGLERLVPGTAVVLARAIEASRRRRAGEREAILYMDHASSAIVTAGDASGPGVMRALSFGVDQFAGVVARAAAGAGEGDLRDHGAARAWLLEHGFPTRDQTIGRSGRLTGAHVLPALHPVCQRVVVEVRQSLRLAFGLADVSRASLVICGPGAEMAGFARVLAEQLEIAVEEGGELPDVALESGAARALDCAPASVRDRRATRRSRLIVGACAAAALAIVAGEALLIYPRFESARQREARFQGEISRVQSAFTQELRDRGFVLGVARLAESLRAEIGPPTAMARAVGTLASMCDDTLRLTDIRVTREGGSCKAMVSGVAFYDRETAAKDDPLSAFLTRAAEHADLGRVALDSARAANVEDRPAKVFTVVFDGFGSLQNGDAQ